MASPATEILGPWPAANPAIRSLSHRQQAKHVRGLKGVEEVVVAHDNQILRLIIALSLTSPIFQAANIVFFLIYNKKLGIFFGGIKDFRISRFQDLLGFGRIFLFVHVLGVASVHNGDGVAVDGVCEVPFVSVRHVVVAPSG